MEAKTSPPVSGSGRPPSREEREEKTREELPDGAPPPLVEAATPEEGKKPFEGDDAAHRKEEEAIEFLLGSPAPLSYDIELKYDVPGGRRVPLVFTVRQLDGKRIVEIENEHRTAGSGPFSELDEVAFSAALAAEATQQIKMGDKVMDPASREWIGKFETPFDAMRARFAFQSGLLAALAARIRQVSGYDASRVGEASRPITDAVSG